jgi:hypothetical protein
MVGEDQSRKLADLTNDLKRPYSTTGEGKQIQSGYSYWGIEPATRTAAPRRPAGRLRGSSASEAPYWKIRRFISQRCSLVGR